MNKYIVKISISDYNKFTDKLIYYKINYILYEYNDTYITIEVDEDNLSKLNKYLGMYEISIINRKGTLKYIDYFKNNIIMVIMILFFIISIFILNNIVFFINVNSSDKNIKTLVLNNIKKYNIDTFTFKKSHNKLDEISKIVVENNKDKIKYMEMYYDGFNLNIYVIEKDSFTTSDSNKYCDVVAKSDGKIEEIYVENGDLLVNVNDYVKKGDLLISGNIKNNEDIKESKCARGDIYAEVWYKVYVSYPINYNKNVKTNKKSFNIKIKNNNKEYKILKDKYKNNVDKDYLLFKLYDFSLYFTVSHNIKNINKRYSEEEVYNRALNDVYNKINNKLDKENKEEIVDKKVLKKVINNSKIELEVFVITKENIAKTLIYKEGGNNDKSGTNESTR